MQDYRTGKRTDGRGGFAARRWPKAPRRGTVRHARAPRFARHPRPLGRLRDGVPGLGAREKSAGNRGRSRVSRRRRARAPRPNPARKPAVVRRLAPPLGPASRGRQRRARRPQRRRGGAARRAPPHPAGRRSGARGTAAAGLARADVRFRRAVALRDSACRGGSGFPPERSPASGDRGRRGLRRRTSPRAVRGGARLPSRATGADARRRPGRGRGERTPRGLARRFRSRPKTEMAVRAAAGRRAPTDSDGAETTRILFAWAKGAAHACDLAAELRRRAQKLAEAAPKLRAKGAGAALQALLDQDSLAAATPIAGLSERGARRLFERLAALGAIRELTGRATFRLYGL